MVVHGGSRAPGDAGRKQHYRYTYRDAACLTIMIGVREISGHGHQDMKIAIKAGYTPGIIGKIAELHATYYNQHWGLDLFFEAKVATELSNFLLNFDTSRDGFWYGTATNRFAGSIALVGSGASEQEARLRWLIVAPSFQRRGLGENLIEQAVRFCRRGSCRRIYLTTFAGLDQAPPPVREGRLQTLLRTGG